MIIRELKDIWYHLKIWKKILIVLALFIMLAIFVLVAFNIIKPVWILWTGFVIFIIILIMRGKKGIRF